VCATVRTCAGVCAWTSVTVCVCACVRDVYLFICVCGIVCQPGQRIFLKLYSQNL